MKGLQERKHSIEWDDGGKIGNKNELILTEIFPSVHETWCLKALLTCLLMNLENYNNSWKKKS